MLASKKKKRIHYRLTGLLFMMSGVLGIVALTLFSLPQTVSAAVPFQSYNYNVWGESVPVPATYEVDRIYDGKKLGTSSLKEPGDIYVDDAGKIYVLDSGNGRILVLDSSFHMQKEITGIETGKKTPDGAKEYLNLATASGLFVTKTNTIWVALGVKGGLAEISMEGKLLHHITQPTGKNAPKSLVFNPLKVSIGPDGTIYTVSEGVFQGIIELSPEGLFLGYFGSNRVDVTLKVITEMFWKKFFSIFSKTTTDSMIKIVPIEYSSIDMNSKGFIYAVTSDSMNSMYEVKKLDPKGNNIIRVKPSSDVPPGVVLNIGNYGDIESAYDQGTKVDTKFIDVCVDDNGFIYSLDLQRGRIFEYDQESNLIAVFGGLGFQRGTFQTPVSIECINDRIIVLDKKTGEITLFKPTQFGQSIRNATMKFNEGLYQDAEKGWFGVLKQSANYELAYTGIGKALFSKKQYTESMKYFKLAYDKKGYDEAYTEYRKDLIRANLPFIGIGIIILLILIYLLRRLMRKRSKSNDEESKTILLPISYVLFHPFKASDDVRTENKGSLIYSAGIVLTLVVSRILKIGLTGFLFNNVRMEYIKVSQEIAIVIGLYLIWIVANWAVSTLMEGEGRVRDIAIITAYALIPLVFADIVSIVLSNVLTIREGAFLAFIASGAVYWTVMLLFVGVMTIHRYTAGKTILSMLLTVTGILFILFLFALVYSLFSQMVVFFGNIFTEIMYRI
jgi:DNA-binding beta-propeller fold protein YncE